MEILIIIVAALGLMWLITRPQRKQMREQQNQLRQIQPGTRVMLTSGIFATVREVGDRQLLIELAPGVDVPVVRQAVSRIIADPAQEEDFVFDDQLATTEADDAQAEQLENNENSAAEFFSEDLTLPEDYFSQAAIDDTAKPASQRLDELNNSDSSNDEEPNEKKH